MPIFPFVISKIERIKKFLGQNQNKNALPIFLFVISKIERLGQKGQKNISSEYVLTENI